LDGIDKDGKAMLEKEAAATRNRQPKKEATCSRPTSFAMCNRTRLER
jgi:hypothetical protein